MQPNPGDYRGDLETKLAFVLARIESWPNGAGTVVRLQGFTHDFFKPIGKPCPSGALGKQRAMINLTLSHTAGTTHHSGKPATARLFDGELFGGPGTLLSSSESVAPRKGTTPDQVSAVRGIPNAISRAVATRHIKLGAE